MGQKSISQLDTIAQAHDTDLFEVAAVDSQSASGYKSGKMSAEVIADGLLSTYTYPTAMPNMQNKTITGALNTLLGNFAPIYDSTATYAEGDVVTYNGQLYRALEDILTPESFDSAKWEAGTAADFFEGGGGGAATSSLEVIEDIYSNTSIIFFDNDDRFEVTYTGGTWSIRDLFTYDGQNMYSSSQIGNNQTSTVRIKNISGEPILIYKIVYQSSTEGSTYDYGTIAIEGETQVTNIGGSVSGETGILMVGPGITLTLSYKKDSGTAGGKDNVGMLIYELGGHNVS